MCWLYLLGASVLIGALTLSAPWELGPVTLTGERVMDFWVKLFLVVLLTLRNLGVEVPREESATIRGTMLGNWAVIRSHDAREQFWDKPCARAVAIQARKPHGTELCGKVGDKARQDEGGRNGEQDPKAYWALGHRKLIRAHDSTAWAGRARYHADDFSSRTLPATTFVLTVGARTAARDPAEPGGKGVATGHGASAVARAALGKLLLLGDLACPRRRCT